MIWRSINSSDELSKVIIILRITADYHIPDWGCLVDFFAFRGEKLLARVGIELTTFDRDSQPDAFDHLTIPSLIPRFS